MGRRPLTANQKAYRRKKKEEKRVTVTLRDGTTRQAETSKGFWIPAAVKEHLDQLVIDRMQSQGHVISDQIYRCLSGAVHRQDNRGRQARRRGRHKDSVQIVVMIKNSAVTLLKDYCKLTGETMSATVTRLIKVAAIDTGFDCSQARAALNKPLVERARAASNQRQAELDKEEMDKYGSLLRHYKHDSPAYWDQVFQRQIHAELEEELGRPLDF